jgi:agmatinase
VEVRAELAVVQLDAHADTATDLWGVKWSHGSPFRHLVDDGMIPGEGLVQVGLRGYWPFPEEFAWMRDRRLRWHRMDQVSQPGIAAVIDDVLGEVSDASRLYVSVDATCSTPPTRRAPARPSPEA